MNQLTNLYWAAGFIEGEGCFFSNPTSKRYCVCATQVEREPLERLQKILGGNISSRFQMAKYDPGRRPVYRWAAYGTQAAGVAMTLWPLMSQKRRKSIEQMLLVWESCRPERKAA